MARVDTAILSGRPIAAAIREEVAERASALAESGTPVRLAVVLVGDDPGSRIYSGAIRKAASKVGVSADLIELSAGDGSARVAAAVADLSRDPSVSGIIVQRPLPEGLSPSVVDAIAPEKDVDGATTVSLGRIVAGRESFAPATALAVIEILERSGIPVAGKHVVIVGRSAVVGRPLACLLLRKSATGNATVTVCHTGTVELARHTLGADIVVAAMGRPEAIRREMVSEGAVVVDVGVNEVDDPGSESGRRLVGDVAFEEMLGHAGAVTPVPGGVGALTTAILLRNTVEAAEKMADTKGTS